MSILLLYNNRQLVKFNFTTINMQANYFTLTS